METAKRGSSFCRDCGTSNGNRAQRCKLCSKPLRKVVKLEDSIQYSTNVTSLLSAEDAQSIIAVYSVRVRDQGPDYRCLVSLSFGGTFKCYFKECQIVQNARIRSQLQTGEYI